ncbi:sprT family metallopeptidase [Diplocarpon rosae]|nr:sprT family metallopeptidase [Diplocarpon rosae]
MARKVEESDGEFPDLVKLLSRNSEALAKNSGSGSTRARKTTSGAEPFNNGEAKDQAPRMRLVVGTKINGTENVGNAKPRPKKRILNKTFDNPLLRPLASSSLSRGSSESPSPSKLNSEAPEDKHKTALRAKGASFNLSDHESGCEDHLRVENAARKGKLTKKEIGKKRAKTLKKKAVSTESDEEDYGGTSGLSDFIVDDSVSLDEDSIEALPPRSARKLVQRRRQPTEVDDSESEDLGLQMARLQIEDGVVLDSEKLSVERELKDFAKDYDDSDASPRVTKVQTSPRRSQKVPSRKIQGLTSKIEDPFTLSGSPPESPPPKGSRETRFTTPPGSPVLQPRRLQSPKKQPPRIPSAPHRPSMDSFWQQDMVNDWNDEYSPQKFLQPKSNPLLKEQFSPRKIPTKQDQVVRNVKKAFSASKHALAESFLVELDNKLTNGEIAKLAAPTGGVRITWSKKLNTTAGRANWRRETIKSSSASEDGKPIHRHHAAIELAEKVIDDEERLLNVLAHEFCHLANFMISNIRTNPHGKEFKAWAAKCSRHFGHRGIEVTTKHRYAIDYKYVWECISCSTEFKRHSKSIDPARHLCGRCKSKLVQTKPVPRAKAGTTKASEYQVFVRENMKRLREENPGSPQKDLMGLVGKEYQIYKASKLRLGLERSLDSVGREEDSESKGRSPPGDTLGLVVRQLDFLDLTSP